MIKSYLLVLAALFCAVSASSQAPVITNISGPGVTCSSPGPGSVYQVSASNNPVSYNWFVFPSNGVVISNGNSASPGISFPTNSTTTYTVYCTASNASGTSNAASIVVTVYETPTVTFSGNTNLFCQGSSTNLSASPTILSASSTLSYSWTPSTGLSTTTGSAVVASPPVSTHYTVYLALGSCTNSAQLFVNVNPFLVSVNPAALTVCKGSSAKLTASGSQSYTWSTGSAQSTISVLPQVSTNYTVMAVDTNGCAGSKVVHVTVDSTCSDVWPGDANSDGVVDAFDALELGFSYLGTGPARNNASNNYMAQHAANWAGTVSTGKNKCHADCNGDGTVNLADTIAIYGHFSLTHSFRTAFNQGNDLVLHSDHANMVLPGDWNKLDILMGDETNPASLYGVVFDINFDQSMVEAGQAYMRFTPSFLNSGNQNVEFRKTAFSSGKIHVADVRTDGADVTGSGKIGEFYFKVKQDIPQGVVINVSISNSGKVKSNHVYETVTSNNLALNVNKNPVGLKTEKTGVFSVYPNPAGEHLSLTSAGAESVAYVITDLTGRAVASGSFVKAERIEVTHFSPGIYMITLSSSSQSSTHKLLISK